ncbi:uncharacterized protein LOC128990850 [Macrosteles quadrilineatus]|uniref:uncharacterized protein LOC128990850 n=1 Tax=Macrosteles quadrilineatus TaxID=74068 RepID=UPI0023E2AF8C|nr:uncharacterized protein LOC128990850 [Macrosteles quadrilineatus]
MMLPTALIVVLAAAFIQVSDAKNQVNQNLGDVHSTKSKDAWKPVVGPTRAEIEKMVREDGAFKSIVKETWELVAATLMEPIHILCSIIGTMITILKLAIESLRQTGVSLMQMSKTV